MFLNRQQLAMSLCTLVQDDYELLNDILIEYCMMIDNNKLDALEQHVNNNINELIWGLHHYYRVWSWLDLVLCSCYNKDVNKRGVILTHSLQQLMTYYQSLVKTIDKLKAEGKEVKLTQLPSVINIKRKSIRF